MAQPRVHLRFGDHHVESPRLDIKNNGIAVTNQRDGAAMGSLRRDMTGHQAMGRSGESAIGNKRDGITQTGAHKSGGNTKHLAHPGPAFRPFVANDNDVVRLDLSFLHGLKGVFLAIENPGRAFVDHSFMPRNFNHTTLRRQITFENHQPPGGLQRVRQRAHDLLSRGFLRDLRRIGEGITAHGQRIAMNQAAIKQALGDELDTARFVQIIGDKSTTRA